MPRNDQLRKRGLTTDGDYPRYNYTTTALPGDDLSDDAVATWKAFLKVSHARLLDGVLSIRSFSGADTRVLLYAPDNEDDKNTARAGGYVEELKTLQTLTISSHRPPAYARKLGNASATTARGVRTNAGSLIFNRTDANPFTNFYASCNKERQDLYPFFIDQLPPFHIIIHSQNEMGIQASMAILYCQISDTGQPFSVDDLTQEDSYTYTAEYIQPFMDRDNWRQRIRSMVSGISGNTRKASNFEPLDVVTDAIPDIVDGVAQI